MSSATIGSLNVMLGLNSAEFNAGVKRAQSTLDHLVGSVKDFAIGALAGWSLDKIAESAVEAVHQVAELGNVAENIGITAEQMQNYNRMALASGASTEVMLKGLQSLAEQSVDAKSNLSKLFEANGLNAQGMKSTNDVILAFTTLLHNAKTPAEQLAIATSVLGDKVGRQLVEAMRAGADGVNQSFQDMVASGEYHSNAEVARLKKLETQYNEVMARIATRWQQMIVQIVSGVDYLNRSTEQAVGEKTAEEAQAKLDSLKAQLAEKQAQSADVSGRAKFAIDQEIKSLEALIGVYERATRAGPVAAGKGDLLVPLGPPENPTKMIPPDLGSARKQIDEAARALARLKAEGQSVFEDTRTPLEHYNLAVAHLNELLKAGVIDQDTFNRAVKAAQEDYFNASKATDELAKRTDLAAQAFEKAGNTIGNDLGQAFDGLISGSMSATDALKSFVAQALKDLGRLFLSDAFQGIANMFGGGSPSQSSGLGFFGSIFSGLASAFGGFFAGGGTLGAGKWGIAGEAGAEIVHGPATITPLSKLALPNMGPLKIEMPDLADFRNTMSDFAKKFTNGGPSLSGQWGTNGHDNISPANVHLTVSLSDDLRAEVDTKVEKGKREAVQVAVVQSARQNKATFGATYRETQVRQF